MIEQGFEKDIDMSDSENIFGGLFVILLTILIICIVIFCDPSAILGFLCALGIYAFILVQSAAFITQDRSTMKFSFIVTVLLIFILGLPFI